MPDLSTNSWIGDNHFCGAVGDFLKPHLTSGSKLSVVSARNFLHGKLRQVYALYCLAPEEIKIVEEPNGSGR